MIVAVMTSLFAERNMNINASHLQKISQIYGIHMISWKLSKLICLSLVFFLFETSIAQAAIDDYWLLLRSDVQLQKHRIDSLQNFDSQQKREEYLLELVQGLRTEMYLEASVDSMWNKGNDTLVAQLHIGELYQVDATLPTIHEKKFRSQADLRKQNIPSVLLSIDEQLSYWEEHGYPFAEISWDTLDVDSLNLKLKASIDKGPLVIVDSLVNRENGKISESFLRNYLGMKKEMPYRESFLQQSDDLLKKLPFVRHVRNSSVNFSADKAIINVYLAQRKVSKFDFLIGLLPNNKESGKMLVTGEARLLLQNAFKRGEELFLEWKRVKANSQQLKLRFNYPYILKSPIGTSASFSLDKRDSTFMDLNWTLGIPYRTKANNYIQAYVENTQSIVLHTDTIRVKNTKRLPNIQDISSILYGFEGYYENLDYLFNPRRGIELSANIQVGTKKIKPNYSITRMGDEYAALYDTVKLKSLQAQFRASFQSYFRLTPRQVIKLGFIGSSKLNKGIAENEMYRIGGANLLRGFDEESIFAQHFAVATLEYRFILEQNSYFYTFMDAAYVSKKIDGSRFQDFPFGFGAGLAFESKAGIFGVSYAIGREQKNPIDFRTSKLHFGYVNIF